MMEQKQLQCIIEGALLAAAAPLSLKQLSELFITDELSDIEMEIPDKEALLEALNTITENCTGRGFEIKEVASGWRFQVRQELAPWVNRLWDEKPQKYTRALLETLSLIAYRQPITRGDIEEIRGVAVSSNIIRTLVEREWVKVVGHRDVPGRPSLYATTREFLDYFNLKSLDELPTLSDIKDFEEMNAALDLHIKEQVVDGDNDDAAQDLENAGGDIEDLNADAGAEAPEAEETAALESSDDEESNAEDNAEDNEENNIDDRTDGNAESNANENAE